MLFGVASRQTSAVLLDFESFVVRRCSFVVPPSRLRATNTDERRTVNALAALFGVANWQSSAILF
jgi:hypothetical protein